MKVEGYELGDRAWKLASRIPLVGRRVRWLAIRFVHRFFLKYYDGDGRRIC